MDLEDGRFIRVPKERRCKGELPYPHWVGSIPQWTVAIDQEARSYTHRSEVKTTPQLAAEIGELKQDIVGLDLSEKGPKEMNKILRDRQLFYHSRYIANLWPYSLVALCRGPGAHHSGAQSLGLDFRGRYFGGNQRFASICPGEGHARAPAPQSGLGDLHPGGAAFDPRHLPAVSEALKC